jgi:hypothetical protein
MLRRTVMGLLALSLLGACAGPAKLAQKSEEKLAGGEPGRAWNLATRALDKDPGNVRARQAATAAGNAMARDWEHRIHVLAQSDTLAAADQVLQLSDFRVSAVRYAAITVSPEWSSEEQLYRGVAARAHTRQGMAALRAKRPKRGYLELSEAQRFVPDDRMSELMDKTYARALTRVAVTPFSTGPGDGELGREVASEWRDRLADHLSETHFTRVLGSAVIEQQMSLSQLGRLDRDDAILFGRRAGAERVIWGSIGEPEAHTKLNLFTEIIARRVTEKDAEGNSVTRWVDVPIEVVARVRTVTANVEYEVIATKTGGTLAHRHEERTTSARVVWTSYVPEGSLDAYALVSDIVRSAHPDRAKAVETHWKETCGDNTTLQQVLEQRRATHGSCRYQRSEALPRLIAGAAFVFLQDLPPAEDLAFAALATAWQPVQEDLARLDEVDDVDLGLASETERADSQPRK